VNVSSAAGLFGLPAHAAYSAAKFGLRGISEVLRFDLEPHGIFVSLVCPGAVDTGLVETVEIVGVDRARADLRQVKESFRRRAVTPEVAAAAILRGVDRKEYLVFTSRDVRVGYFMQTKIPFLYERAMRLKNRALRRFAEPFRVGPALPQEPT
jgi:short-subunit dehydrogenase